VLPQLPSVNALITDPPYGIVNDFGTQNRLDGTRRLTFAWDSPEVTEEVVLPALGIAMSKVANPGAVFVFCGGDQFGRILECARRCGFTSKPAAWVKKCPPPACPGNWWPSGFELAVYGYASGAYFADECPKRSNVFTADSYRHGQPGKVDHPTQKPLDLMRRLVGAVVPVDGLVLDCFFGSGTTGLAAKQLGRKCIGIEIEERYCEIAANRLRQEVLQFTD